MGILLAFSALAAGIAWHAGVIRFWTGHERTSIHILGSAVGGGFYTLAAWLVIEGYGELSISLWALLALFSVFYLFIDAAWTAVRFHVEDSREK